MMARKIKINPYHFEHSETATASPFAPVYAPLDENEGEEDEERSQNGRIRIHNGCTEGFKTFKTQCVRLRVCLKYNPFENSV